MTLKKVIGFIVIILVITIGVFAFNQSSKRATEESLQSETVVKQESSEVEIVVKQVISSYLKSPGSAQYPELVIKKSITEENQYVAFGDVDSQNTFGGLMRSHFFLKIIDKGGEAQNINNWTVDSLDLGDLILVSNGKPYDTPLSISDLSVEARMMQKQIEDFYRELK
ncbi:MAG: hypothetical protein UU67_C0051G0003 [Candidatus Daviesbacteria bacterium GW2011_GWB1_41_5]|uniref:Uncharacterized protein n=1 Tax=Candidatus Daviesbacteria bacterium GW2011_GWB1_41_5 TaxID=1618429 RepID=A0A0G0WHW0_9BACT|nr:MAG: hypothetical protein UU67_C0051G0003 [Candidatus Daviesbacteria bacterium GW2011_GWB1_41_5]